MPAKIAVVVVIAFLVVFNARADVIYEQLPPNTCPLCVIDLGWSSTLGDGQSPGYRTADDFVLARDAVVSDVHWWGVEVAGGNDFQFTFYNDVNGVPGSILQTSGGSLWWISALDDDATFYSSYLDSPFSASAGTTYWISIFNQTSDASWAWVGADDTGNGSRMGANPGPPWPFLISNSAFQLTSVPEPATLALLGLGLAGLGIARRLRQ